MIVGMYVYVCMHEMYVRMYVCMYVCMHVCSICMFVCMPAYMYVPACLRLLVPGALAIDILHM